MSGYNLSQNCDLKEVTMLGEAEGLWLTSVPHHQLSTVRDSYDEISSFQFKGWSYLSWWVRSIHTSQSLCCFSTNPLHMGTTPSADLLCFLLTLWSFFESPSPRCWKHCHCLFWLFPHGPQLLWHSISRPLPSHHSVLRVTICIIQGSPEQMGHLVISQYPWRIDSKTPGELPHSVFTKSLIYNAKISAYL